MNNKNIYKNCPAIANILVYLIDGQAYWVNKVHLHHGQFILFLTIHDILLEDFKRVYIKINQFNRLA